MKLSTGITGNLAMVSYAIITALSSILIHETTQVVTPLLSAFNTFLFCLLIYTFFSLGTFKKLTQIKSNIFSITMLNVTTAICWIFTFFSLKYIPPELYLFVYLCAMPIFSTVLYRTKVTKSLLLFSGLVILFYTYHNNALFFGVLLAFVGGSSGTVYSIYSKRITGIFTTSEILSLRFYLVVITTFMLCMTLGSWESLSTSTYGQLGLLSLVSVVLPLTLFQVGLKNLNIMRALSYMPLAPLLCYFLNLMLGHQVFNGMQFGVVIFIFVVMFL